MIRHLRPDPARNVQLNAKQRPKEMIMTYEKSARLTQEGIKALHHQLGELLLDFRSVSLTARNDSDELTRLSGEYRNALEQLINELTDLRERMAKEKVFDFGRMELALRDANEKARKMGDALDRFNARPFRDAPIPSEVQDGLMDALADALGQPRLKGKEDVDDEPIPRFLTAPKD